MKASPAMQAILLEIADTDLEISRDEQDLRRILEGEQIALLRDALASINEAFLELRNAEENLAQEIGKVAGDLESVEKRIAHDQILANASSSAKDIAGIEHELKSLRQRKSDLEDAELALLEELDTIKASRAGSEAAKAQAAESLASAEASAQQMIIKARSTLELHRQHKSGKVAQLSSDLVAVYERLFARGIAVARLVARDCGACRIALTAAAYDDVMATPVDELTFCPNCQAILIRQ